MQNENIISKEEKISLLKQCLPVLEDFLLKINNDKFKGKNSHYKDAITACKNFKFSNFEYKYVFFFTLAFSPYFIEIKRLILDNQLDVSDLKDPFFWEKNKISIHHAIFFSSIFIGELFKNEIENDFKKLENLESVKEYFDFRKDIIKKSDSYLY